MITEYNPRGIPQYLRDLPIWALSAPNLVNYFGTEFGEKAPLFPVEGKDHCRGVSSNDPSEWRTFDEVDAQQDVLGGYAGLMVSNGFIGIDFDLEKASPEYCAWFKTEVLPRIPIDAHCERSPSGIGYRIIVKGTLPKSRRNKNLEMYNTHRFLRMTGAVVERVQDSKIPVMGAQEFVDYLYSTLGETASDIEEREATAFDQNDLPDAAAARAVYEKVMANIHPLDRIAIEKADSGAVEGSDAANQVCVALAKASLTIAPEIDAPIAYAFLLGMEGLQRHYAEKFGDNAAAEIQRKFTEYWWPDALVKAKSKVAADTANDAFHKRLWEEGKQIAANLENGRQARNDAEFEASMIVQPLGTCPNENDLQPIPLPNLRLVQDLRRAVEECCDAPEISQHAINYATFLVWTTVMGAVIDLDGSSAMVPSIAVGDPGAGKTQSTNPLNKVFDLNRLVEEVQIKHAALHFREYNEMKSPEGFRDKPKSRRVVIFVVNDADALVQGLDQDNAKGKFSGFSTTFIKHYDGRITHQAAGAGSEDEVFEVLVRPRVVHIWNIQPKVLAPLLTESVMSKGTASRIYLVYLPTVDDDETGEAVVMRKSRFRVPTWIDNILLRYADTPDTGIIDFIDGRDARRRFAQGIKEFKLAFPAALHSTLAHMRETTYRIAAMYDGTARAAENGTFAGQGEDAHELSVESVDYALSVIRESYRLMHYLDGKHGLGLMNEISAIRHGWKGILAHARAQAKAGAMTLQPSQCIQLARKSNKPTINMLLDELCNPALGVGKIEGKGYRVLQMDKLIVLAKARLIDAGGVDEPYAK